jgi:regulator of protease activity HflC (stomatin/prohibitin superfamily)
MKYYEKKENNSYKIFYGKIVSHVIILIIILIFLFGAFGTIKAGKRGVLLTFGKVGDKILGEGLYFKLPLVQHVQSIDVQIQKEQVTASAASKDLQEVSSVIALNYHLNPVSVNKIWRDVGKEYNQRIIDPAVQETVKASTALFTAEELITKRESVRDKIKELLTQRLLAHDIIVDEFNIVNFDFSKTFNEAIEAKVTAEQNALAAKNKLEQTKYEAQQAIEAAKGKAQALQIEGTALAQNPAVIQLRWIDKWNGSVPTYWGQATPFIGIK